MTDPADPVLPFDEDGRMFILHEPALADEVIESVPLRTSARSAWSQATSGVAPTPVHLKIGELDHKA
jgi:hypothetical protein